MEIERRGETVVCFALGELNDVQYSIQILDSPVGLAPDGVSFKPPPFHNSIKTFPGIGLLILFTLHLSVQMAEQSRIQIRISQFL
jgi:hypothetical protein